MGSMFARMWLVTTLIAMVLTAMGCATAQESEMQLGATVAAELTRLAPMATPEPTYTPQPTTTPEPTITSEPTAPPEPTATPTVADLVSRLRPSLAQIVTPSGSGSGFVYDESGLVTTNAHVVDCCREVTVILNGGRYQGTVLGRDDGADLAVVRLDSGSNYTPVALGNSKEIAVGDDVMAMGYPLSDEGDDLTITRGIVSARREIGGYDYLQTDAALNPGNSGGPLINHRGEVIGMNSTKHSGAEGVGFALSIGEIADRLRLLALATPSEPRGFQQVSAGLIHTCEVVTDGRVVCWGSNNDPLGTYRGQATPSSGTFQQVSAGGAHTCGVKTDGRVACWGWDQYGQATPQAGTFQQISTSTFYTCGVKTDGKVACWGWDLSGEATPPAGTFQQVSAGESLACGVKTDGRIVCWGLFAPLAKPPPGTFQEVSTGTGYACGVKTDGQVACWGNDDYGRATPPAETFEQISAGAGHTCGVKTDGRVACWGSNERLDTGKFAGQARPPAGTFQQVSAGAAHTCGVKTDGRIVCWGNDDYGQATPP